MAVIERAAFSDPWPAAAFREVLEQRGPARAVFLVAADGDLVGYVLARQAGEESEILNLAVAPAARRRGVARELVRAAMVALRTAGAKTSFLEVRESNAAALALYQSFGFAVVGKRSEYYRRPTEDALILRAAITAGAGLEGK